MVLIEVAQFLPLGIRTEPAAAPVSEPINRREQPRLIANVIKLMDIVRVQP